MHLTVSLPQAAAMATTPSPRDVAANLQSFSLPDLQPIDDLITLLTAAENALSAVFTPSETTAYLAWITSTRYASVHGLVLVRWACCARDT